jgi:hypothetical protein
MMKADRSLGRDPNRNSASSLTIVFFATPVIRTVARMEQPSTGKRSLRQLTTVGHRLESLAKSEFFHRVELELREPTEYAFHPPCIDRAQVVGEGV